MSNLIERPKTIIKSATVKVMRSHDYNHFEASLCLENESGLTLSEIDKARKNCARLTDSAVNQYIKRKRIYEARAEERRERDRMEWNVDHFKNEVSEKDFTPDQKAQIKALEDWEYKTGHYDYEDEDEYDWPIYQ